MRLGNYIRVFSALSVLLLWHSGASAEDYYWQIFTNSGSQLYPDKFSSPSIACSTLAQRSNTSRETYEFVGLSLRADNDYYCRMIITTNGITAPVSNTGRTLRRGDTCPSGTEYNSETGECAAPENSCLSKAGQDMNWSKSGTSGDGFGMTREINGKPMFFPGMNACFSGCAVETTRRDCTARVNGNYFCRGTGRYTGVECPSDVPTGSDLVPEDTVETPEPQNLKDEQPCIYVADGSKEVCTSSKTDEVEGQICATLEDGSEFCTTKLPEKNGIDIRTEVTKETLADGSIKTTKKDVATVTNCVGVNNCTTTKAETTKTTTEDANGNKTGESSTCKGDACPGKGNPDSDGDGVGDCTGDDCGAGGGGEGQDWYTPTGDTFGSVLTEFVGKVQQTPIASQTTSFLTFRATGSCPRWSVSVWVFDIDIDQLCNGDIPWNAIKAVILAAAGFFAFRIALL